MDNTFDGKKDEEIIDLVHSGNDAAMEYLLNKYKNMVRGKAKALFIIGGDRDDLIQEGMIGLYKAIRDFNPEKKTSFATFAELCTARRIYSAISMSQTKKNQPLNNYISIDGAVNDTENSSGDGIRLEDKAVLDNNPEELLINREDTSDVEKRLMKALSSLEKKVLLLYLKDYSYEQIGKELDCSVKTIDNAIQRIRKKLWISTSAAGNGKPYRRVRNNPER